MFIHHQLFIIHHPIKDQEKAKIVSLLSLSHNHPDALDELIQSRLILFVVVGKGRLHAVEPVEGLWPLFLFQGNNTGHSTQSWKDGKVCNGYLQKQPNQKAPNKSGRDSYVISRHKVHFLEKSFHMIEAFLDILSVLTDYIHAPFSNDFTLEEKVFFVEILMGRTRNLTIISLSLRKKRVALKKRRLRTVYLIESSFGNKFVDFPYFSHKYMRITWLSVNTRSWSFSTGTV